MSNPQDIENIYQDLEKMFGKKSPSTKGAHTSLDGVNPGLQEIITKATNYLDYSPQVTSGFRTQAEQDALNVPGKAKVSKHTFGQAIDQSIKGLNEDQIRKTLNYYNSQPNTTASVHNGNHIHVEHLGSGERDPKIDAELEAMFGKKNDPDYLLNTISEQNKKISQIAGAEQNKRIDNLFTIPSKTVPSKLGIKPKPISPQPVVDPIKDRGMNFEDYVNAVGEGKILPDPSRLIPEAFSQPVTQGKIEQLFGNIISKREQEEEKADQLLKKIVPEGVLKFLNVLLKATRRVEKGVVGTAEGLLSPENIALMALGSKVPAVNKPIALSFVPKMAEGTYEQGKQAVEDFKTGKPYEGVENLTKSLLSGAFTAGAAKYGLKDSPVPEPTQTINAQVKSLEQGRNDAVLITPGEKMPSIPNGFEGLDTSVGTWIYDPVKLSPEQIQTAIETGQHGKLLGHIEPKSINATNAVIAKTPEGVEAKTSLVSPENVEAQAKILKDQFPDSNIEVGGLEKANEVIESRKDPVYMGSGLGGLQKFLDKTPEVLARERTISEIETSAKKSGKKLVEAMDDLEIPFDPQLYADLMLRQRELAQQSDKKSIVQNTQDFYRDAKAKLVDFNSPIEDLIASAQKKGKFEILPKYDYTSQVDMALRAPTLAGAFVKKNGFDKVIESVDDLNNLDQYMIAKHALDVESKGVQTGRNLSKDQALVENFAPKYEKAAQQVNEYSRKLLDYSVESGLVSKELAQSLKEKYQNYVPLNRVFSEIEKSGQYNPKGVASLSKQTVVQKLEGSEREIESPVKSLIEKTHDAFVQGEKNKAGAILAGMKDLPGNPFELVPLRTAENVNKRISLFEEAKELKPLQNKVESLILTKGRLLSQLQREINTLENTGLEVALRKQNPEPPKLKSGFTKKRVFSDGINLKIKELEGRARQIRSELDELNKEGLRSSLQKKQKVAPRPLASGFKINSRSIQDFPAQSKARGKNSTKSFIESLYTEAPAQLKEIQAKIANRELQLSDIESQIKKLDGSSREKVTYETNYATSKSVGPQSTKKFIDALITEPNIDIQRIKAKIATRGNKLNSLLDDISYLREGFDAIKERRLGLLDEARLLKDAESRGKSTISFINGGVKEIWETTPEIAAAAKALNVQQLNILGQIFAAPVRLAKIGITGYNVPFTASNLVRDQFTAFINSKNPLATMPLSKAFFKSLLNTVKRGSLYDEVVEMGAGGTIFDMARNEAPLTIDRIRSNRSLKDKVKYTVKHPSELLRAVEDIIGRSEQITRMQQYEGTKQALLKQGRTLEDAKILAGKAARENTANFQRRGEWGTVLNSAFLYLNASIQGSRAFIRAAERSPVQTAVKVGTAILFPAAVSTLWNLSDPERRKAYEDIPDYVKDTNLVYIPPNPTQDEKERWNVIKIPLEPGIGKLAIPMRRLIEQMNGMDQLKFGEVADSVFSAFSPVDPSVNSALSTFTPQLIKPAIQAYSNKNFFTGGPIVPPSLQDVSPDRQVKPTTSGTARQIGKKLNASPMKVEAFIRDTAGGVGQQVLNAVDRIQAAAGNIPKEQIGGQSISEGIISRFTKAQGGNLERNLFKQINAAKQKQTDKNYDLKLEAEKLLKDWSIYSQEKFNEKLNELQSVNPDLAKKVEKLKEKEGLGASDKAISGLGIKNGTRAQFIYERMNTLKSKEEKKNFLIDLENKGLLTDEVFNQLLNLKQNKPISTEEEGNE